MMVDASPLMYSQPSLSSDVYFLQLVSCIGYTCVEDRHGLSESVDLEVCGLDMLRPLQGCCQCFFGFAIVSCSGRCGASRLRE